LEPDGVRVLEAVLSVGGLQVDIFLLIAGLGVDMAVSVGMLDALGMPDDLATGLAGDISPDGVLGLDDDVPLETVSFLPGVVVPDLLVPILLLGILEGISSVLSNDRLEPCLDGGLLPGLLPVLEVGLELFLLSPGVTLLLYEYFLGVLKEFPSVSDKESGVPAE
jgi:hypothetical protein